jgi:hypothetical protein
VDLDVGMTALAVAAGGDTTCALLAGGRIKCWGENDRGQLGQGDRRPRGRAAGEMGAALNPIDLSSSRGAVSVAVGGGHVCALIEGGDIVCWGANGYGQLGVGDSVDRGGDLAPALAPVDLGTGRTARSIAAGANHTCAVLDTHQLKCWGANARGALGIGDGEGDHRGERPGEMGDDLPVVRVGTAAGQPDGRTPGDDGGGPVPPPNDRPDDWIPPGTKFGLGSSCGSENDCLSGHCVDGLCCEMSCPGTCSPVRCPTPAACTPQGCVAVGIRCRHSVFDVPSDSLIRPELSVNNNSPAPVSMSDLKVRYWYTADGTPSQAARCEYAEVGTDLVRPSVHTLTPARPRADTYVELTFSPATQTLERYATAEIRLTVANGADRPFNETDDHSWSGAPDFTDCDKVTLYYKDVLIWGAEP